MAHTHPPSFPTSLSLQPLQVPLAGFSPCLALLLRSGRKSTAGGPVGGGTNCQEQRSCLASHRAHPTHICKGKTRRHLALLFHAGKLNPVLIPVHTASRKNLGLKGFLKTTGKYQQYLCGCRKTSEQEHLFPVKGDEVSQATFLDFS